MSVIYETGDIFATPNLNAFAHGCNCAGVMGKGIAVTFRKRWPGMYAEYRRRCEIGSFSLGDVFVWEQNGQVVFNLGTQKTWKTNAVLSSVETALMKMVWEAESRRVSQIALPRVGSGLGGLEWQVVRALIERIGASTLIMLRVCEEFVEGQPLTPTISIERGMSD